jgi:hypothetical protein
MWRDWRHDSDPAHPIATTQTDIANHWRNVSREELTASEYRAGKQHVIGVAPSKRERFCDH